eukprot:TRINITY_DN5721_c0_g1_i1.p1 TRINITY_DN5721_c0_g1~~TRINITY_DN5721_c0_g1_i1.p1  ORF type:complete len:586 (+),score=110.62 TRINITY_DN5721_c0_g1_i1:142-1899(+)
MEEDYSDDDYDDESTEQTRNSLVSPVKGKWIPDNEFKKCGICKISFGLINRRHHCRMCGKIYCGECSKGQLPIPTDDTSQTISHTEKPTRLCDNCYVVICERFFMPDTLTSLVEMLKVMRLQVAPRQDLGIGKASDKAHVLHKRSIKSEKPTPAVDVYGDKIGQLNVDACRIECPREVYPFPLYEFIPFEGVDPWVSYRTSVMKHGRALVIDGDMKVEIDSCIIEGRVGVAILGCSQQVVIRNCLLRGECALEVRKNSNVLLENCILIGGAPNAYKEDNVAAPWGTSEDQNHVSAFQEVNGPCLSSGNVIYCEGSSILTINQCAIYGVVGIYATENSKVNFKNSTMRTVKMAADAWGSSSVIFENSAFIGGTMRTNTTESFIKIEEENPNRTRDREWIPDQNASKCMRCEVAFSITLRKHHCRLCARIFCDSCVYEKSLSPAINSGEIVRTCVPCTKKIMLPPGFSIPSTPRGFPSLRESSNSRSSPTSSPLGLRAGGKISPVESTTSVTSSSSTDLQDMQLPGTSGDVKIYDDAAGYRIAVPSEFNRADSTRCARWIYTMGDRHFFCSDLHQRPPRAGDVCACL